MKSERPVDLLLTNYLPITAITSITHRITGMILFVGAALLIYVLDLALESETGLAKAREVMAEPLVKFVLWGVLTTLGYHLIAGIKHLLLDFHVGDTYAAARLGSQITIGLAAVLAVLAGVWLW